jgi:ComF family protein
MATLARSEFARPDEDQHCDACREARPQFEKACAYGSYDGELRDLIHLLKYEQVTPAASLLGEILAGAIAKLEISRPVLIIPVPLHSSKRRQRRFNQAELIARAALKRTAIPGAELATNVLVRQRAKVSQIGLTRPQRAEDIRGAFRVEHREKIAGRSILLVDDVLTTGTTTSECARVLRKAGAAKVWVATVARTLKHSGRNTSAGVIGDPGFEVVSRAS